MPPQTRAEATSYKETSLHAHVMEFIAGLAARHDPRLAVSSFGTSPGGRDLPLCVLSAHGVRTPGEPPARPAQAPRPDRARARRHPGDRIGHQPQPRLPAAGGARDAAAPVAG